MYYFLIYLQLFDMKKFQSNVNRELRRAYPDRRSAYMQCLSAISFVRTEDDVLDCPIWVLIVNVVAMDMLKSKLPPGMCVSASNSLQLIAKLHRCDLINHNKKITPSIWSDPNSIYLHRSQREMIMIIYF